MSKKILAALLVVLLILAVAGVLFLNKESTAPATTLVPEINETTTPETDVADDMQYDDSLEETRIILSTPDDEMLNELLSDKVIRDDKIVDKSQAGNP